MKAPVFVLCLPGGNVQINTKLISLPLLLPKTSLFMGSEDQIQLLKNISTEFPESEQLITFIEHRLLDRLLALISPTEPSDFVPESWQRNLG